MVLRHPPTSLTELQTGWVFSVPLMAILLAHEFGHFFAGRYHRVDVSPPYFIPIPFFLLGTLGAVIQIRERIRSRNALLDIGAAGPLAGLAVALPVIIYGIATSPVEPLPEGPYMLEGRSLLYLGLLSWLKGPIPEGYDIMLTPTALAGWAGLLVTMINLLPFRPTRRRPRWPTRSWDARQDQALPPPPSLFAAARHHRQRSIRNPQLHRWGSRGPS